jgi:hypothetical protein
LPECAGYDWLKLLPYSDEQGERFSSRAIAEQTPVCPIPEFTESVDSGEASEKLQLHSKNYIINACESIFLFFMLGALRNA